MHTEPGRLETESRQIESDVDALLNGKWDEAKQQEWESVFHEDGIDLQCDKGTVTISADREKQVRRNYNLAVSATAFLAAMLIAVILYGLLSGGKYTATAAFIPPGSWSAILGLCVLLLAVSFSMMRKYRDSPACRFTLTVSKDSFEVSHQSMTSKRSGVLRCESLAGMEIIVHRRIHRKPWLILLGVFYTQNRLPVQSSATPLARSLLLPKHNNPRVSLFVCAVFKALFRLDELPLTVMTPASVRPELGDGANDYLLRDSWES